MHSPHQRDAHPQPVCSRRIFLGSAFAASASVVAGALAGCQRPSTLEVVQPTTGGGRDDLSDSVIGKDKIRIGMEAAYAPYNWQVSEASEFTIPIDNVQGAYADGYDVQIAKIVCKALGGEPVAVKQSFSGLIDSLNNGQIDLIIAGMSATPERERTSSVTPSSSSSEPMAWLTPDWVKFSSSAAREKLPHSTVLRNIWYLDTLMAGPPVQSLSLLYHTFSHTCKYNYAFYN